MNREKARQILGEGATEEQVTNFLNEWHKEKTEEKNQYETQLKDLQNQISKYSDYDVIKKEYDNYKQSQMTEQEKLEQMKKEAEQNLKNSRIIVNTAKAKDILAGLNVSDTLIAKLVDEDETQTVSSANELKTMLESTKELAAKQTKENLMNVDIKPTISNVNQNDNVMTFEKFGAMSAAEQNEWLEQNPNGLENLN